MDLSSGGIIAGFVVSTVGLSVFVYGKRQLRPPQLVAGVLMMACPFVVAGPLWISLAGAALAAGVWFAVRAGL